MQYDIIPCSAMYYNTIQCSTSMQSIETSPQSYTAMYNKKTQIDIYRLI